MSFSKDFLWGAASAAYQVEGAYNAVSYTHLDVYKRQVPYCSSSFSACSFFTR